jgi:putative ABC transport system permease protein
MQIKPILSALRMHKAGTLLIAMQIALTLAVVCNALFIIRQRVEHISRPTGIDESNLLLISNHWIGRHDGDFSLLATDLATLRQLPGVQDAYATNAYPLIGGGWASGVRTGTGATQQKVGVSAIYFVDDHALATLGAKLIEGRNFRPDEVRSMDGGDPDAASIIISKALADKAFPQGSALGKLLYLGNKGARPSTVIGVLDSLQSPSPASNEDDRWQYTTLVPLRLDSDFTNFVVRVRPGQMESVEKAAPAALRASNRMREIPDEDGVRTFTDVRHEAYESDRGMAILMGIISVVLLAITAAGIVGLTSFWVGQRRRQIGVRRALGATRGDILSYFLTENLLIGIGGVVIGTVLAVAMNLWLMHQFEMNRLAPGYVAVGVLVLLVLGQCAVLAPAIRASHVPPVEATRSV